MWICLNDAFLSIVQPKANDARAPASLGLLVVRARRAGDIERVFPGAEVLEIDGRDYSFRAYVPRGDVGVALMNEVQTIDYTNFKDSVRDDKLHDAYARFWNLHAALQVRRPYARRSGFPSVAQSMGRMKRRVTPQFGLRFTDTI